MAKKDILQAAAKGADLFFTGSDPQQQAAVTETQQPHRAQDETPENLLETIESMRAFIEADAERKRKAAEDRATKGRAGFSMPRMVLTLTPSAHEHVRVMAGLTGTSMTRYINDLIAKDAERNKDIVERAKELMNDAR